MEDMRKNGTPAQVAGFHELRFSHRFWIPAFAGMTSKGEKRAGSPRRDLFNNPVFVPCEAALSPRHAGHVIGPVAFAETSMPRNHSL